MSATVSTVKVATSGLHSKQSILAAIERAFGNRDEAEFTISVSGQESIIIREAMRRYCAPPSKAEEILAAITPEGYEYSQSSTPEFYANGDCCDRRVFFRRIAPPVEYEYVTDGKVREPLPDDYIYSIGEWRQYKLLKEQFSKSYDGLQLCFRRVEVKR